jgi:hypothetical protein
MEKLELNIKKLHLEETNKKELKNTHTELTKCLKKLVDDLTNVLKEMDNEIVLLESEHKDENNKTILRLRYEWDWAIRQIEHSMLLLFEDGNLQMMNDCEDLKKYLNVRK